MLGRYPAAGENRASGADPKVDDHLTGTFKAEEPKTVLGRQKIKNMNGPRGEAPSTHHSSKAIRMPKRIQLERNIIESALTISALTDKTCI